MLKTVFEKETCGRCGGSGRYSYNAFSGSVCFGCNGAGERLTKRGGAARASYLETCKVALGDVVVGDVIEFRSVTLGGTPYSRKATVARIEHATQRYGVGAGDAVEWKEIAIIRVWNAKNEAEVGTAEARVRKYWPKEINDSKVAAALAYQATLTKLGKPAKAA